MPRAAARASDRLLELLVVAFAGWTAIYHVCLVAQIGSGWAALAGAAALGLAAWFVLRGDTDAAALRAPAPAAAPPRTSRRRAGLLIANLGLAAVAAAGFGLTQIPYRTIWLLRLGAAACSLAWCTSRLWLGPAPADSAVDAGPQVDWLEIAVVAVWAIGLAVLSLLLLDPDPDDAFYVHFASWVAAHGQFPTRDVVYSNQVFPALDYPPVFSYDALTGTVSRVTGLSVPDLQYSVVTPLGTALSVLATWRLLRAWRVPMVALALTATLVFLLFDAAHHMTFGAFFANRMWQGKVLLLAILVPLLFALLHDYGDRPGPAAARAAVRGRRGGRRALDDRDLPRARDRGWLPAPAAAPAAGARVRADRAARLRRHVRVSARRGGGDQARRRAYARRLHRGGRDPVHACALRTRHRRVRDARARAAPIAPSLLRRVSAGADARGHGVARRGARQPARAGSDLQLHRPRARALAAHLGDAGGGAGRRAGGARRRLPAARCGCAARPRWRSASCWP